MPNTHGPESSEVKNALLWQDAVAFATRAHRHQIRKDGTTPYASHVVRVGLTVSFVFGCHDPVVMCIALLHDTIEDTTTDYDDLAARFGPQIADGVAALTKNMALPEQRREAEYDERLAHSPWYVRMVKLADAFDNLCDVVTTKPEFVHERRRSAMEKAQRAIEIARSSPESPAELIRGITALQDLMARQRAEFPQ